MLSERLKRETQQSHLELEKLIIPKIKNIQSTIHYSKLLQVFYGFFKPVEVLIDEHINTENFSDHNERRKAAIILSDIKQIEPTITFVPVANDLPKVENTTQALGAMYVLEGSTLGGKIISKMIVQALQLKSKDAVQFFSGYGEATEERWNAFKTSLENYTTSIEEEDQLINAANETFVKFKNWVVANNG